MAKQEIRVGLIGAGGNTKLRHIPGFQAIDGVRICSVCNRSEESSRAVAEEYGIPGIGMTWRDVVGDPEIDVICIGTWPYMHAEISIAALNAGKHVLCEARMAMNLEEAEQMAAAHAKHPDLVAQVVPSPFTLDVDATINTWLNEGRLGDLLEVRVAHTSGSAAREDVELTWRQHFEYSGLNVLTMGIFHEAVQRWIPDDPEWLQAAAAVFHDYRIDPETERPHHVRIPESLTILGEWPDKTRLIYHFSSVESGQPAMEIRLNGSKGALRFDGAESKLWWAEAGESEMSQINIPEERRHGWRVEADFIDSIRNGSPVRLTSFEEGVRYMRFTQRVFDSYQHHGKRT